MHLRVDLVDIRLLVPQLNQPAWRPGPAAGRVDDEVCANGLLRVTLCATAADPDHTGAVRGR
jgi:hypothetical protein